MSATTAIRAVLNSQQLQDIAYYRILKFAAERAPFVGTNGNLGFDFGDLDRALPACIDRPWVKRLLPSICTLYRGGNEVEDPQPTDVDDPTVTFVIKSEEYIKLIGATQMERIIELTDSSIDHFDQVSQAAATSAANAKESERLALLSLEEARKNTATALESLAEGKKSSEAAVESVALARKGMVTGFGALAAAIVALFIPFFLEGKSTLVLSEADRAGLDRAAAVMARQESLLTTIAANSHATVIDSAQYGCLLYAVRVVYRDVRCPGSFTKLAGRRSTMSDQVHP